MTSHPQAPDESDESDETTRHVLRCLAEDVAAHPERVKVMDARFVERLRGLTQSVEVNVDAELSPDDE